MKFEDRVKGHLSQGGLFVLVLGFVCQLADTSSPLPGITVHGFRVHSDLAPYCAPCLSAQR